VNDATPPSTGAANAAGHAAQPSADGARSWRAPLAWFVVSLVVLLSISYLLDITAAGIVPVLQALTWFWVAAAAATAALMALRRHRVPAVIVLCATLLAAVPLFLPGGRAACAPGTTDGTALTVMSFNAKVASADTVQLSREILQRRADVVVLLEVDQPMVDALRSSEVGQRLPYMTAPPTPGRVAGSVIMSRFAMTKIAAAKTPSDPRYVFDQPAVRIDVAGTGVLVHAVHAYPPILSGADAWHESIRQLGQWQRMHPDEPVIMAGDFNSSRAHPVYRYASKGMTEASRAAGPLTLSTWPVGSLAPNFVALDHILVRRVASTHFDRITIEGSDHQALAASLSTCST
jgi:endonuclease/exonuclease/phosphatase (EEP) superfamily protein YafD